MNLYRFIFSAFFLLSVFSLQGLTEPVTDNEKIRILLDEHRDKRDIRIAEYRQRRNAARSKSWSHADKLYEEVVKQLYKSRDEGEMERIVVPNRFKLETIEKNWATEHQILIKKRDAEVRKLQNELVLKLSPFFSETEMEDIKQAIYGHVYYGWYREKEDVILNRTVEKMMAQAEALKEAERNVNKNIEGTDYDFELDPILSEWNTTLVKYITEDQEMISETFDVLDTVNNFYYLMLDWFCDHAVLGYSDKEPVWLIMDDIFANQGIQEEIE